MAEHQAPEEIIDPPGDGAGEIQAQDPAPDVPVEVVPVQMPVQVTPVVPTQVANPWRTSVRTFLQVLISGLAIWPVLAPILEDTLNDYVEPAKVATVIGAVSVLAAAIARIMAIPQVNSALSKLNLGAAKK